MNNNSSKIINDKEIDLQALVLHLWSKKLFILKITIAFIVVGIFIAVISDPQYEASSKVIPETQNRGKSGLSDLGGLAGLAGIDLNIGGGESLTPQLYPEIVKSALFQLDILHSKMRYSKLDSNLSYYEYFTEFDKAGLSDLLYDYTVGLPATLKKAFRKNENNTFKDYSGLLYISKNEWALIEDLREKITVSVNDKNGIISINCEMPDPLAAGEMTSLIVKKLTEEVTDYKIEKAKQNLEFIEELYKDAEQNYQEKQRRVAKFSDQNRNISTNLIQIEFQRYENEMNIAYEVYKGLASKREQAKIQVREETPVFTILEPVRIPQEKSSPNRKLIVIVTFLLGFLIGSLWVTTKKVFQEIWGD